jgi:CDP-diacylglycerol--glycerol-3-phosphate 3-phosphatidyltransferase
VALTDWLDGFLARRYEQTSEFGAFLDPVADKLMVATALIMLTGDERVHPVLTLIIIGREITISALREWMAELGERATVAVSWMGKVKTAAQMAAIVLLLLHVPVYGVGAHLVGTVLLVVAALLTLWSMTLYLRAALPAALGERD